MTSHLSLTPVLIVGLASIKPSIAELLHSHSSAVRSLTDTAHIGISHQ